MVRDHANADWITPRLKDEISNVWAKAQNLISNLDDQERSKRIGLMYLALSLPGLRLAERRQLIILSCNAPIVGVSELSGVVGIFKHRMKEKWQPRTPIKPEGPDTPPNYISAKEQEQLIEATAFHLKDLNDFISFLSLAIERKQAAVKIRREILGISDEHGASTQLRQSDFPITYGGYEVDALAEALRDIPNFPLHEENCDVEDHWQLVDR